MPEYILLLNQPEAKFDHLSPEEMQALIAKYSAWRDGLVKRSLLRGGNKLVDRTNRILRTENGKVLVTEGPFSESQEILGGYFIIEAPNYDEAVAIARTCPHLIDGQSIELRQIDITPPPAQQ
jgi:hypothetical protein